MAKREKNCTKKLDMISTGLIHVKCRLKLESRNKHFKPFGISYENYLFMLV